MQVAPSSDDRSFSQRANDRQCRQWTCRASRFARGKLRLLANALQKWADDPRVLRAWRRGWDDAHYLGLVRWRDQGFAPRVVYDIGAHQGLWMEMCQEVFAPEKCYLFEPQHEFQERAKARQARCGGNWEIVPVALGDHDDTHFLHLTENAAASSLLKPVVGGPASGHETRAVGQEKVHVVTLDHLAAREQLLAPDLVKIDVQGYEGRVLAGGRATLSRAQRIVVEVSLQTLYAGQSLMPEVLHELATWGFVLDDLQEAFRDWPGQLWQVDLWLKRIV